MSYGEARRKSDIFVFVGMAIFVEWRFLCNSLSRTSIPENKSHAGICVYVIPSPSPLVA